MLLLQDDISLEHCCLLKVLGWTLTLECGSAWTEAVAVADAPDIAIHVGP